MVKMGKPGSDRSGNAVEKSNAWFLTHHTSQTFLCMNEEA